MPHEMIPPQSRERWSTTDGVRLIEAVTTCLVAGAALPVMELGTVEGRIDLRGFPIPQPTVGGTTSTGGATLDLLTGVVKLHRAELTGIDLRGAVVGRTDFFESRLVDVRLDGADCRGIRFFGCTVRDSSLRESQLDHSVLGSGTYRARRFGKPRYDEWVGVSFRNASMRQLGVRQAVLRGCDFSGADLSETRFQQCTFDDVRFGGNVDEVTFDARAVHDAPAPPPMRTADFTQAVLNSVTFFGYGLDGVRFADDPDVRVIRGYRSVFERVLAAATADPGECGQALARLLTFSAASIQNWPESDFLFNRRDYALVPLAGIVDYADAAFRRAEGS